MTPEVLEEILVEQFDAEKEGGDLLIPTGKRVTLLLQAGDSLMPVNRVRRISFTTDYVSVTTEEERYFIDVERLFGVRQDDYEARPADARPGFHHG
ncbi:hypothetical protein FIV42_28805 [Persicimonas caeni]|jgi:hypothetical protein|uniref:Uncharacterized protein n=1 Tax=Persicimonas caeni TaxID=2292766 RepID=A0A4Y6Q240_PERCE|nr:hypothetical protein [Persicimonas caeni]QDG54602.1 hypothetical protein FIV42_28805 [Persicimonas caeni]QED35823.1 hypothetical protein FRD00_28800 [Persicimonas caeni]